MAHRAHFLAETHVTRRVRVILTGALIVGVWLLAMAAALNVVASSTVPGPILALIIALAVANMNPPRSRVVVGVDGVSIRFGRKETFLPTSTLAHVDADLDGVCIRQRVGDTTLIIRLFVNADDAAHLVHAIRSTMRASSPALPAIPERGTKTPREYLASLRELTASARTYRAAGVTREALFELVESGDAPAPARVAAAVALRVAADPAERQRLSAAAQASAHGAIGQVLVRVADEGADDRALEEALIEAETAAAESA